MNSRQITIYTGVIFIILQCRSWLVHLSLFPDANKYFKVLIAVFLLAAILQRGRIKVTRREVVFLLTYLFGMALLILLNNRFIDDGFISTDIVIFTLVFLLSSENGADILKAFSNIIYLICACSIFFFIAGTTLHIIQPTGQFLCNWGGERYCNNYFGIYSEMQPIKFFNYNGYRNTAIWVEGPMLAYSVIIALYFELFMNRGKIRKHFVAVYIITVITSCSTIAIIFSAAILFIRYYKKEAKSIFWIFMMITLLIATFTVGGLVLKDKMNNSFFSYSAHIDDILSCLKCFFAHPFIGIGYNNAMGIDPYRLIIGRYGGLSTGFGGILAYGGLLWGIWYIIPLCIAIKNLFSKSSEYATNGFILTAFALIFFVLAQETALCAMYNAFCWRYILDKKEKLILIRRD